jgi:hypothetical protein
VSAPCGLFSGIVWLVEHDPRRGRPGNGGGGGGYFRATFGRSRIGIGFDGAPAMVSGWPRKSPPLGNNSCCTHPKSGRQERCGSRLARTNPNLRRNLATRDGDRRVPGRELSTQQQSRVQASRSPNHKPANGSRASPWRSSNCAGLKRDRVPIVPGIGEKGGDRGFDVLLILAEGASA